MFNGEQYSVDSETVPFAIFVAVFWLWADEEGHSEHFSDARSSYKDWKKDKKKYEYLQPYFEKFQRITTRLGAEK